MKNTNDERLTREALAKLTQAELQMLFSTLSAKRSFLSLDIAYAKRVSNALINATLSLNEGSEDNENF